MAEAALARRYARALVELGQKHGNVDQLGADLATVAEQRQLLQPLAVGDRGGRGGQRLDPRLHHRRLHLDLGEGLRRTLTASLTGEDGAPREGHRQQAPRCVGADDGQFEVGHRGDR